MIFNKKLALAVSGAVLLMAGQAALADSTTDIVDALISKGVLTEEEGKLISKGAKAKADATPTVKEKDGAFSISSPNGKNSIQLTGRLHFDTKFNDIGGGDLIPQSTSAISTNDTDTKSLGDHFNVRRARIGIKGRVGGIADYLLLMNMVGSKTVDEAYLDINKYEPLGLKFGMFKQPLNLEIMTSSNNIDMIERSYISQNAPEKRMGVGLHGELKGITYAGSAFQNNDSALSMQDNKFGTAGRATINFGELNDNKDLVAHVGLNGYSSNFQLQTTTTGNTNSTDMASRGTLFSFTSGGQGLANLYRAQIGDVAAGQNTCSATVSGTAASTCTTSTVAYHVASPNATNAHADNVGLEGILAYNNFKLQGEYSQANYKASATSGADAIQAKVDTWYAEALWIITGEKYSDAYKKGAFGLLKPKNEFNMDTGSGYGLWELGFRVDAFDVSNTSLTATNGTRFQGTTDGLTPGVTSGKIDTCSAAPSGGSATANSTTGAGCGGGAQSYTGSIKWVMNPNMLIKANYTYTKFDNAFAPIDIGATRNITTPTVNLIDHENLLMIRGQYMF